MIEIFDKIQCDVKNMILFSQRPMFIFNENRNIVFCNSAFIKKFNFSEKDAPVGKIPDFLYTMISDQETLFSEIPIDFLIEDDILFQIDKNYLNEENLLFKLILDKIKTTDNSILYLSSLIEITEIKESLVEKSINALLKASQLKDNDTGNHIQRINEYSYAMSIKLLKENGDLYPEITKEFCKRIKKVASMHDVGKIGIPDYILTKPGKLTEEEFKIMQEHTINGAFILSELAGQMARDIALFHHEKWNGLGYPYGFKEDQIPLSARIVAIADVYDALRMKRSYKESIPHEKTIKMVIEGKGSHFDPTLIDKFLEMDKEFNEIFEKMNDER